MSERALYRRYRPSSWKEVLGQDHITEVLSASVKNQSFAHAYLFAGSRGTGKTSVARIFAADLGIAPEDIYEIDAASNRGIDDIRQLREGVGVLPMRSAYKIYIIDEAHMLTKEAWNALLKTIEEPPKHVLFVFATTEFEKVPDTIVSRCQGFSFRKPSLEMLKKLVLDIAKKEGFVLEPSSAELIALLGDGSFRDTQGTLQKVLSASRDKKITPEEVELVVGAPRAALIDDVIAAIAERDAQKGLSAVSEAVAGNAEMKVYIKLILRKLRALFLLRFAPNMRESLAKDFTEEELAFLEKYAKDPQANLNSGSLKELIDAYHMTGLSFIPQVPLEIAIVKLTAKRE